MTHVELSSLSSCSIRGKLTWSSVVWFGRDAEKFLLTNNNKCKLLNIEDGSIIKHNPLIERFIQESLIVTPSKDGEWLLILIFI